MDYQPMVHHRHFRVAGQDLRRLKSRRQSKKALRTMTSLAVISSSGHVDGIGRVTPL
jgi:hypothetical protein